MGRSVDGHRKYNKGMLRTSTTIRAFRGRNVVYPLRQAVVKDRFARRSNAGHDVKKRSQELLLG